jgi:hypothetical protein
MKKFLSTALLSFAFAAGPPLASADDPLCAPELPEIDLHRTLRALSLDLRGVVPSVEEHQMVEAMGEIPDALLDEWMASEAFADRATRRHAALFWPAIDNVRLIHFRRRFRTGTGMTYFLGQSAIGYRGVRDVGCLDRPQTELQPDYRAGGPVTATMPGTAMDGTAIRQEGYALIRAYWDPAVEIKVCAFDAQDTARSTLSGVDCNARAAIDDVGCGCGPTLMWCDTGATHTELVRSFEEEFRLRVRTAFLENDPYTALFTSRRSFVNGPLVFFWTHQAELYDSVPLLPRAVDPARLPELAWTDKDTFAEVELPAEHAGVLTAPVFLLRFQTNRARANRFYDAFRCQPFQPPSGGIPVDDAISSLQTDLQLRSGCNYCHALLEPAAAHWGRWTMQGGGYLDPASFPAFRAECLDCARGFEACSDECRLHYMTRAVAPEEEPYLGMLRSFAFLRPEHQLNVDMGPKLLVENSIAENQLPACVAERAIQWLYGRDSLENELAWKTALGNDFLRDGFDYRALVRSIVTDPAYRRVR